MKTKKNIVKKVSFDYQRNVLCCNFAPLFYKTLTMLGKYFNPTNRMMSVLHKFIIVTCIALLGFQTMSAQDFASREEAEASEVYQKGQKIWDNNCASCHKVNAKLIGPPLTGVYDKYEREWLYKWIKNNQALVKSGDALAAKAAAYDASIMTAFPMLKNEDIDATLVYIKANDDFPVIVDPEKPTTPGEIVEKSLWTPANIFIGVVTLLLLGIFFALGRLITSLDTMVREKDGDEPAEKLTVGKVVGNRWFRVAATLTLFGLLSYTTYENASGLGYMQGYQPEQPIKFSHALHAGKWEIDCQYCHSGANKGKSAVIPSTNICMNCHKSIKEGPQYGTKEIAKIYDAVGWDVEKQAYKEGYEGKPVEWVRIHNLPDHVYFNHAQHVNAGGLECQTCHGQIQEMEVVEQHSDLSMGWCIECHRNQEVNFNGNDYYLHHYEKLHKSIKDGDKSKVTVQDIGGLECQKCHY